jgi:glycosyltransferase involved in cell wall biosynthesis
MKPNPLFSILMANYNNASYIAEAIESVIEQTYTNWEIIIVDDASTDNSAVICNQYAEHPQIKVYYNELNKGCGYTKNRCAKLASGEIIGILDPDDKLSTSDALKIMVEKHKQYPEAGVICSRHRVCKEDMKVLWTSGIHDKNPELNYLLHREHNTELFVTAKTTEYHKAPINPFYRNAEDQDFFYRMEEVSRIYFVDDVLYDYRTVATSLTHRNYRGIYWHIRAICEACERRNIDPEEQIDKLIRQIVNPSETRYQTAINSRYYKTGKALLQPLYKIAGIFKK